MVEDEIYSFVGLQHGMLRLREGGAILITRQVIGYMGKVITTALKGSKAVWHTIITAHVSLHLMICLYHHPLFRAWEPEAFAN